MNASIDKELNIIAYMNKTKTLEKSQKKFKTSLKDSDYNSEQNQEISLISVSNYQLPPILTQKNFVKNLNDLEP